MYKAQPHTSTHPALRSAAAANDNEGHVSCDCNILRDQLLQQWARLTAAEIDHTDFNRHRIAELIQKEYGIPAAMAENYLRNFEKTLPLFDCH